MKWMVPINNLDAIQARTIETIVSNTGENHWVKGFAGSGKTIVLTHVLERLASSGSPIRVCFATYTHALKDLVESGLSQNAKHKIDISTFNALGKLRGRYDLIVADEMQDIPSRILPLLTKKSRVFVIAADLDQSIYRSACSVAELNQTVNPAREHQLREIHRINENIFEIATTVYNDARVVSRTRIRADEEKACLLRASSIRDEFVTIYEEANRVAVRRSPSAILLPSKALLDKFISIVATEEGYMTDPPRIKGGERPELGDQGGPFGEVNAYLKRNESSLQVFGGGSGSLYDSDTRKMVYLMTYHSAKGLDFANVFLPHFTSNVSLEPMKGASDDEERRLFFVASTRARERLYISYHEKPHRFLSEIPKHLLQPFEKQKRRY